LACTGNFFSRGDTTASPIADRSGCTIVVYTLRMDEDRPKSALELAMERLRQKDADSGEVEALPTDAQKAAIAEARSLHASKVAELEILHRSKMLTVFDPAERVQAEDGYRRELGRLNEELERKIGKIRRKGD